jgi:hypothetical protein
MVVYTVDMSIGLASTIGVSEILWVILRSLSRDIENFPMSVTDVECQVIPFWTGYEFFVPLALRTVGMTFVKKHH